jgi:Ca-activated chloride channel family protein
MLWRGIDFLWVQAAWLLPLVFLIAGGYALLERYRRKNLEAFGDPHVLNVVAVERSPVLFWAKVVLLCIVWICGVAAVMMPRGNPHLPGAAPEAKKSPSQTIESQRRHDIVFVVDVSASMGVADNGQGDSARLSVAKEIVDSVISRLKGENVALEAFTSQALPIIPLTTDYLFTRLMLRGLTINEGETAGTDMLKAVESVGPIFEKTPSTVAKTLVLLSDGEDTTEQKEQLEAIKTAADALKNSDVRLITVGLGSLEGKKVPDVQYKGKPVVSSQKPQLLQAMASPRSYYDGDLDSSLVIAQKIGKDIDGRTIVRSVQGMTIQSSEVLDYDHYFQYPLAIALAALSLFLVIPDTLKRKKVQA